MNDIIVDLKGGFFKRKLWGIMKGSNKLLGGGLLQPLVDGLNKKIDADKGIKRGFMEANIETIKRQVNNAFDEDEMERKKAKAAKKAGFGQPAPGLGRSKSVGGRRTKRRRRGKKSRKHTKKKTTRRRKHTRTTKRRCRRSKLGKRRTKRGGMCCGKKG